jgi:hypothetical protein
MTKIGPPLIATATATLIALITSASMAHGNERGSVEATINGAHISIDYGRPALKGRDMLKQIQPGQLWRIGADAPTTLESDKELNFSGTIVPKGKHILLARLVEPGKWTLVFSSKSVFQYEPSAKLAEIPLTFQEASDSAELVTIQLTNKDGTGIIEIAWGKMRLSASFKPA